MSKGEYFNFIHVLRGLASLIVVWSHLVGWWLPANLAKSELLTYWENFVVKPFHLFQNGGHLGVLIFFLISGYVVTHVSLKENIREFVIKRFFRIIPTLLVALIITYLVVTFSIRMNLSIPLGTNSHEIKDYVYSFFLLNFSLGTPSVLGVTWTLFIEVIFYIVTAVLLTYTKKEPLKSTWYFMVIIGLIVILSPINPIISNSAYLIVYILFLVLGRIIYFGHKQIIPLFQSIILAITCFFLFVIFYDYLYPNSLFTAPSNVIYSDLLAIVVFFVALILFNKNYKVTSFLGDISYSLYLVHLPIGCLVLNILFKQEIPFKYSLLVAISICFVVSYVIFRFIEKPSQRIAKKIIKSRII